MDAFSKSAHFIGNMVVFGLFIKLSRHRRNDARTKHSYKSFTINRWIIPYAPLLENEFRKNCKKTSKHKLEDG